MRIIYEYTIHNIIYIYIMYATTSYVLAYTLSVLNEKKNELIKKKIFLYFKHALLNIYKN